MSSAEALFALIGSALPPAASISLTSRFALSSELRYVNATAAPSDASRLTIPSPIPREPPVTRATLPANDRPYFSVMSILQSGPNLSYWIILSIIRFRFLSVRRVQFHSFQINNENALVVTELSKFIDWPETLVLYRMRPIIGGQVGSGSRAGRVRYRCLKEAARGGAFMQGGGCWGEE